MKEYKPQIGDIIIIWGKGIARLLSFVITSVFGVKNPATHVQMVVSAAHDISAEQWHVKVVRRVDTFAKARKYIIVRHTKMVGEKKKMFPHYAADYVGKRYDVWLYVLWIMRLAFILNPIIFWVLYPVRDWVRRQEKKSYACSELTSTLLNDVGIKTGFETHRNAAPHHFRMLADACECWEVVYRSEEE